MKYRLLGSCLFSLLILLIVSVNNSSIYCEATSTEMPKVWLSVDEPIQSFNKTYNKPGFTEFNITVHVNLSQGQILEVHIIVLDSPGSAVINPENFTFHKSGKQFAEVQLNQPAETNENTICQVICYAKWILYPDNITGETNPLVGRIDSDCYQYFLISTEKKPISNKKP